MRNPHDRTRGLQRGQYALFLLTAALATVGVLTESMWFMALAAWALISAGLIEMIYRP